MEFRDLISCSMRVETMLPIHRVSSQCSSSLESGSKLEGEEGVVVEKVRLIVVCLMFLMICIDFVLILF